MKTPILFNRLGSDIQVGASILGAGLTVGSAVTYSTGKFGNAYEAVRPTTRAADAIYIPSGSITFGNQLTIEFWYQHTTSFSPGPARFFQYSGTTRGWFSVNALGNNGQIMFLIGDTGSIYQQNVWDIGTYAELDEFFELSGAGSGDGAFHHYAFVMDDTEATEKSKIYKDGALTSYTTSTTTTLYQQGSFTSSTPVNNNLYIGENATADNNPMQGIMDNVKIYDYAKSDFSDRFNERGGLNDLP